MCHTKRFVKRFLYKPGDIKKELQQCLRSVRAVRRSSTSSLKGKGLGSIPDAIPISERPPEVADIAIPGHWEGDLVRGTKNSYTWRRFDSSQGASIMRNLAHMNQFVALQQEDNGQQTDFIGGAATTLFGSAGQVHNTQQLLLSSTNSTHLRHRRACSMGEATILFHAVPGTGKAGGAGEQQQPA